VIRGIDGSTGGEFAPISEKNGEKNKKRRKKIDNNRQSAT
jgi:hypothetical protein